MTIQFLKDYFLIRDTIGIPMHDPAPEKKSINISIESDICDWNSYCQTERLFIK